MLFYGMQLNNMLWDFYAALWDLYEMLWEIEMKGVMMWYAMIYKSSKIFTVKYLKKKLTIIRNLNISHKWYMYTMIYYDE